VAPVSAPEKPVNWYPEFAVAEMETTAPLFCQSAPGEIAPPPLGVAVVVSMYCVVKFAV
jgi:hypothetical protein